MTGRGRGRPPARQSAEPPAPAGRRSTRQQPPQQQSDAQIDPAITAVNAAQTESMPPPPLPAPKRGRNLEFPRVAEIPRRGTRRDTRAESIASLNSVLTSSLEPQSSIPFTAALSGFQPSTPGRHTSVMSSEVTESPGQGRARAKLMKKFLGRLSAASEDLFTHLRASSSMEREDWEEERKGYRSAFDTYRAYYVPDAGSPVADASYVQLRMGLQKTDPLWSDVSRAVTLANLTSLLDEITSIESEDRLAFLQMLDATFPEFFVASDPGGQSIMGDDHILEQVLGIRSQLFIHTLQKLQVDSQGSFSPYEQLLKIFCDKGTTVDDLEVLRHNNSLHSAHFRPVFGVAFTPASWPVELFSSRMRSFCVQLPDNPVLGTGFDLKELQDLYQFNDFLDRFREFIENCFEKTYSLAPLDPDALADSQIQSQLQAENRPDGRSSLGLIGALRAINNLEHQDSDISRLASQDIIERSHQIQSSAYPPASSGPYHTGFATYAEPPGQANGSLYAESAAQAATTTRRKRRAADDGEDGQAPAKKPRQKRKQNVSLPPPTQSSGTELAAQDGESQYPPPPSSMIEPDFEALSQRSREISAASRKAREPQVRSPWVRNDIKQLVKAVDTFKCKWSLIEKEIKAGTIEFEIPRDQQALRDKARLLKQDFLKADGILPPSFDLVVLGKKERAAVIACGKNPERREADVIDGQPVNTEWRSDDQMPVPAPPLEVPPLEAPPPPEPAPGAMPGTVPEAMMEAPMDVDAESEAIPA